MACAEGVMVTFFNFAETRKTAELTDRQYLIETAGKAWAFGSIYMSLEKLCKRGWVSSRIGEPSGARGGKAIKYYDITALGIRILRETKALQDRMWRVFSDEGGRLRKA